MGLVIATLGGLALGLPAGLWIAVRAGRCRSCRRALQVNCRDCTPIGDPYAHALSSRATELAAAAQLRDRPDSAR